nr:hypothetical protein [Pandoravirus aubagnensis]
MAISAKGKQKPFFWALWCRLCVYVRNETRRESPTICQAVPRTSKQRGNQWKRDHPQGHTEQNPMSRHSIFGFLLERQPIDDSLDLCSLLFYDVLHKTAVP